jgi:hypothetical protein
VGRRLEHGGVHGHRNVDGRQHAGAGPHAAVVAEQHGSAEVPDPQPHDGAPEDGQVARRLQTVALGRGEPELEVTAVQRRRHGHLLDDGRLCAPVGESPLLRVLGVGPCQHHTQRDDRHQAADGVRQEQPGTGTRR